MTYAGGVDVVTLYSYCTVLFSAAKSLVACVCVYVCVCEHSLSEREVLSSHSGRHPREVEHQ